MWKIILTCGKLYLHVENFISTLAPGVKRFTCRKLNSHRSVKLKFHTLLKQFSICIDLVYVTNCIISRYGGIPHTHPSRKLSCVQWLRPINRLWNQLNFLIILKTSSSLHTYTRGLALMMQILSWKQIYKCISTNSVRFLEILQAVLFCMILTILSMPLKQF